MIDERQTDYTYKDDLIRNYINLIIHEALKLQPSESYNQHFNVASRLTGFSWGFYARPFLLKTAQDYANNLNVHVNYLNRAVKEVTGKPTTAHISERIISEAKVLLRHTDWNIADIASARGFEYPTYFNNYLKRMAGTNPRALTAM